MVRSKLPVLLGERRMKISDLHRATGLSKTTLYALYHEKAKGVQFETIEKICRELRCDIHELFEVEVVGNGQN